MSGADEMPLDGDGPIDDETGALLSAFLDGEVTAAEELEVRALLQRSADARAELEALRSVRATVRDLPEVEVPVGFFEDPALLRRPRRSRVDLAEQGSEQGSEQTPEQTTAASGDAPTAPPGPLEVSPPTSGSFRPRPVGREHQAEHRSTTPASTRRHRNRRRVAARGLAALGIAAVVVVLLVGITPVSDRLVPPVTAFAARHGAMERGDREAPNPSEMSFADMSDAALDAAGIPSTMGGDMDRVHGFIGRDGMVHVVFSDGDAMVSVYEQPGAVAWSDMPGGATMEVAGSQATDMRTGTEEVVVVDRGGMIYTVVSADGAHDSLMDVVHALPETPRTMMDRMADGCRSLVESFGASG